jgi:hypothetical protein
VGAYASMHSPVGTWVFGRGAATVVALNMSDESQTITGLSGSITLATERNLEGTTADGTVSLGPWVGVVVEP